MPKFLVRCITKKSYWLVAEAPDVSAVESFYEVCGGDEFHMGTEYEWTLEGIEVVDDGEVDVVLSDSGELLSSTKLEVTGTDDRAPMWLSIIKKGGV